MSVAGADKGSVAWGDCSLAQGRLNGYHPFGNAGGQQVFDVEMARIWPIIVQFGAGLVLCILGVWGGFKGGYLHMRFAQDRRMLVVIAGGFVALLILSCMFTFWLPFLGGEARP